MRKDNTLLDLKKRVSELIGLSINEFVLKRNMVQREFKNMTSKLIELGLNTGALIKVEKGKPHQDGVYEINIMEIALIDEPPTDDIIFDKKHLFKIVIDPT
jgi:hypothetical protein